MRRPAAPIAVLVAVAAALACSKAEPPATPPAPDASAAAWPQPKALRVARAEGEAAGSGLELELRYLPPPEGPAVALAVLGPGEPRIAWAGKVDPAGRDALWGASWRIAAEPAPGLRLAISSDAGATWRPVLAKGARLILCPHAQVPASAGAPDWAKLPDLHGWALEVLETVVWGCAEGRGCRTRSLVGRTVHHGEPGAELIPLEHGVELKALMAMLAQDPIPARLAPALVDAAVNVQPGLAVPDLRALGAWAGRAIGPESPLGLEERKALQLRVVLATEELKGAPPEKISPRESVNALVEKLDQLPKAVGGPAPTP